MIKALTIPSTQTLMALGGTRHENGMRGTGHAARGAKITGLTEEYIAICEYK